MSTAPVKLARTTHLVSPKIPNWPKSLEVGRKLGNGNYGRVYVVRERATKAVFALKVLQKEAMAKYESGVKCEIDLQAKMKHPNVLNIYGYYTTENTINVLLELAPRGEVYQLLQRVEKLGSVQASDYVAQIASGLDYCHRVHHVIHRDLKPENLLLGSDGRIKIADFGCCTVSHKKAKLGFCGTLYYMSPEMAKEEEYDHSVDVWSLGIIAFEFLVGTPMFMGKTTGETLKAIISNPLRFPLAVEKEAVSFISGLLRRNCERRMLLRKVPRHPWIVKYKSKWRPGLEYEQTQTTQPLDL